MVLIPKMCKKLQKIKTMLKVTRKKRSQRCSAISWQNFDGHFTVG